MTVGPAPPDPLVGRPTLARVGATNPAVGEQVPAGRRRRAVLYRVVAVGVAVAALLLAGSHLLDRHATYGVWAWTATSPTPLMPFRDREYVRAGTVAAPQQGFVALGTTWDGLTIYGPPGIAPPQEVAVQVGSQQYVVYTLRSGS